MQNKWKLVPSTARPRIATLTWLTTISVIDCANSDRPMDGQRSYICSSRMDHRGSIRIASLAKSAKRFFSWIRKSASTGIRDYIFYDVFMMYLWRILCTLHWWNYIFVRVAWLKSYAKFHERWIHPLMLVDATRFSVYVYSVHNRKYTKVREIGIITKFGLKRTMREQ